MGDWMKALPLEVTCRPLCLLKIPGSHDSGASPSLDYSLPVANDEGKLISILGRIPVVRKGIKRWSITQCFSAKRQLLLGIRYFDLRVSLPPSSIWDRISTFHLVHGLYGPSVKEFLTEIMEFLVEHPMEVVLLDFNHLYGLQLFSLVQLKQLIGEIFGWEKLCPPMDPAHCTLDFMRSNGYQIIAFMCHDSSGPFWSQESIVSHWPETNDRSKLLLFLEKMLENDRCYNLNKFYVHQGVLTPTAKNIVLQWPSTLEKALASKTTLSITNWIENLITPKSHKVNIVMLTGFPILSLAMIARLFLSLLFVNSVHLKDSFKFPSKRQAQRESHNTGYIYVQVGSNGYYEEVPPYINDPYTENNRNDRPQNQFVPQTTQIPSQTFSHATPAAPQYVSSLQTQRYETTPQQPTTSQPSYQTKSPQEANVETETKYSIGEEEMPSVECFTNEFGFKCCNAELQRFMLDVLNHPQKSLYYRGCNVQKATTTLQSEGQMRFNTSFEVTVSPSNSVGKGTFLGKWMCKVKSNQGKIAVMYAHPHQYTLETGKSRALTEREFQNRVRNNGWGPVDLIETEFENI